MADKKKKKTFMGQDLVEKKPGEYALTKSQYNAILDEQGVTKEVRDTVQGAEEKIAEEAIDFLGKEVLATKENQRLTLGSGHNKTTFGLKATGSATNPKTGEAIKLYGVASYSQRKMIPSALKKGKLNDLQAEIERVFA